MNRLSRLTALKTAAVLSFLMSAWGLILSVPMIAPGAQAINNSPDSPPYIVILMGIITGVVGVMAAYGAWKGQRWGVILTILVNLLNGLSAAPGILFAPTTDLWILASLTVVVSLVIIVLCLWPDRKLAIA